LKSKGVTFQKYDFKNINLKSELENLKFDGEIYDQVLITTNISTIQRIFNYGLENNFEHFVSQVFVYFTVKNVDFKFQYLHINDLNLYCSRISNCSLYSKKTKNSNHLLIAEIPLSSKNKLWDDEEGLKDIAWNEIIKSGIVKKHDKYITAKVLKIPKTFSVPKVNFFKFKNQIELYLEKNFSGKVKIIGQGIFSRHKFIKDLLVKL